MSAHGPFPAILTDFHSHTNESVGISNLLMFARPRIAGLDTESVLCISIDLIWEFILGHFDFLYDAISRRVYRFYSRFEFQPFNL